MNGDIDPIRDNKSIEHDASSDEGIDMMNGRKDHSAVSRIRNKIVNNKDPSSLSARMRAKRFAYFLEHLGVNQHTSILDVGGTVETWKNSEYRKNVTLLNLSFPQEVEIPMGLECVRGNALDMHMFEENRFDIVYSNSVIEHVGSAEDQRKFACEIQRVGKSYWIQTPNKYFPIEPHFLFPFFQFLPVSLQKSIAMKWKYSHEKSWNYSNERILKELSQLRLLGIQEMMSMFSGASLYRETFFGLTKSIAIYKKI